jgi:hypothetical protein
VIGYRRVKAIERAGAIRMDLVNRESQTAHRLRRAGIG